MMRVRKVHAIWPKDKEARTIADAVDEVCSSSSSTGDQIYDLRADAREHRAFTGLLVEMLHEKGIFTNDDIIKLLGDRYEEA